VWFVLFIFALTLLLVTFRVYLTMLSVVYRPVGSAFGNYLSPQTDVSGEL